MIENPEDICSFECLKNPTDFKTQYEKLVRKEASRIILSKYQLPENSMCAKTFLLQYAPVGNYAEKPHVIICGKTTSGDSHDLFRNALQAGKTLHEACSANIYSNMKDNLFKYLNKIGLFDYLATKIDYWKSRNYDYLWNRIFEDVKSSIHSGIQLTQACNCALLNEDKSVRSKEPPNRVFKKFYEQDSCMFKQFRVSENLKLIIFLDTPSADSRFHQKDYWDKQTKANYPKVRSISITHPSRENSDVYNYLDDLIKMQNKRKKLNAIKLFNEAVKTIHDLSLNEG